MEQANHTPRIYLRRVAEHTFELHDFASGRASGVRRVSWFQRNRLTPYGEAPIATQNSYPALNLQYLPMNHFAERRMHRAASTRIGLLFSFDALCREHRPIRIPCKSSDPCIANSHSCSEPLQRDARPLHSMSDHEEQH